MAAFDALLIEWVQSSSNAGDIRNKLQAVQHHERQHSAGRQRQASDLAPALTPRSA
jgi:hypothetical protein